MAVPLSGMSVDAQFQRLEEAYHAVTNALGRKISSLAAAAPGADREAVLQAAEGDVYEADGVIRKMEVEVRHYPYNLKSKAQQRLKVLKNSLNAQRKDLDRAKAGKGAGGATAAAAAAEPGVGGVRLTAAERRNQRRMLLEANERTEATSGSLTNTQRVIEETTEVGIGIGTNLHTQREQLLRSRDAVHDTDDVLHRARKTLRRMARRTVTNKLTTASVILVELIAIGIIVWRKHLIK